jgi:hypothetical protein
MKTLIKVIETERGPILITNNVFFEEVNPLIAKSVLDFIEKKLREKRPEIFKDK